MVQIPEYLKSNLEHPKQNCDELVITLDKYKPQKNWCSRTCFESAFTLSFLVDVVILNYPDVLLSILAEKKAISVPLSAKAGVEKEKFQDFIPQKSWKI